MTTIFNTFNFEVVITLDDSTKPLCECGFSQVDGLEITAEAKTIRSGGDNARQHQLVGSVGHGTLNLKRGMTSSFDLWDWFDRVHFQHERGLRATIEVVMRDLDRSVEHATFVLQRCLPTKLRVPPLHASTGELAIEELSVAYETLRLKRPETGNGNDATQRQEQAGV